MPFPMQMILGLGCILALLFIAIKVIASVFSFTGTIISSTLTKKQLFSIMNILGEPSDLTRLDDFSPLALRKKEMKINAEKDLLNLVESDLLLRGILRKHNVSRTTVQHIYTMTIRHGGGQWAGGAYVPVAAIGSAPTLNYMLDKHLNDENYPWSKVVYDLLDYFENGQRSPKFR